MKSKSLFAVMSLALLACVLISTVASAQSAQVQGIIDGRSGATMTVKTQDGTNVVVLLTSSTQVEEVEGGSNCARRRWG
jgi:OOP family OmpA-OmpF porin